MASSGDQSVPTPTEGITSTVSSIDTSVISGVSDPQPTLATATAQIRPSSGVGIGVGSGGRILTISSASSTPSLGRVGGGGGGFVLRGNQLVRLPFRGTEGQVVAPPGKSPLKVHLVSASGVVKQGVAGVQGSGVEEQGDVKPKVLVISSGQSSQPAVGDPTIVAARQNRGIPPRTSAIPGRDGSMVYYGGGQIGASATVGEGAPLTQLQSFNLSGAPPFKKSRQSGTPGSKKPCNCTKSQCLKLYCECFANGEFCRNCNCTNCHNNLAYENERTKSIKMCLERNPYAFQPKIGKNRNPGKGRADTERLHTKGCNCKKSSCLKNYCECYEAKVPCTPRCKCVGCRNTEVDRTHKYRPMGGLQSLANAASLLSSSSAPMGDYQARADSPATEQSYEKTDPKKMPWFYMTDDVVEATALCLLAKAEHMESSSAFDEAECQKEILKEFGRCLQQIIESAGE